MHKYMRHLGDYARDTKHLTLIEHGAYTVLLDWSYSTERDLPGDEPTLFRLCGAFSAAERAAVLRVRDEFFNPVENGGFRHKRVVAELTEARRRSAKNAEAANDRWAKDEGAKSFPRPTVRNANAMRTHSERIANAEQTESERSANGMPRARVPAASSQQPATNSQQPPSPIPPPGEEGAAASASPSASPSVHPSATDRESDRSLPEDLEVIPGFRHAWGEWVAYIAARSRRMPPPQTFDQHLITLRSIALEHGPAATLEAMARAAARGFAEPLVPKNSGNGAAPAGSASGGSLTTVLSHEQNQAHYLAAGLASS